jgi:hypothetical protein
MSELIHPARKKVVEEESGSERRTAARYALDVPAALCHPVAKAIQDDFWSAAKVHDVSGTGIGLILTHNLDTGQLLAVDLEGIPRLLTARVIHATLQADRTWLVGCEFLTGLDGEELKRVLGDASFG